MNRRKFLKSFGAVGTIGIAPSLLPYEGLLKSAKAAPAVNLANFVMPTVLPQVINVFLYGGPSELGGNLTNIQDINANSQNPYPNAMLRFSNNNNGEITQNGFWRTAGGSEMEDMLASNDMSVYRTVYRRKNDTRAHRPSVFSSQKGNLDIDTSPGMGFTLASVLNANSGALDGSALLGGRNLTDLSLPFISFEGSSTAFATDPDNPLPQALRDVSLDTNFNNPYTRSNNTHNASLEALVQTVVDAQMRTRYSKVMDGFDTRAQLETLVGTFDTALNSPLPFIGIGDPDADVNGILQYPNNRFSDRIQAAVTAAIVNPDSLFISVGGGLGGWDDHNSAIERYVPRMRDLMRTMRAAMKHIRFSDDSNGGSRNTDNIIINVHGDFGRNVNLNNSLGWDHGSNQNLYTFGGAGVRPGGAAALGKVVGSTERFGDSGQNRQFTRPTNSSYECEPLSIASTVYSYFGVQNPEVLTQDATYSTTGEPAIDETIAGEPTLF